MRPHSQWVRTVNWTWILVTNNSLNYIFSIILHEPNNSLSRNKSEGQTNIKVACENQESLLICGGATSQAKQKKKKKKIPKHCHKTSSLDGSPIITFSSIIYIFTVLN